MLDTIYHNGEQYNKDHYLGEGTYGAVFRYIGFDGKRIAIKWYNIIYGHDEYEIHKYLENLPYVVQLLGLLENSNYLGIVMKEYTPISINPICSELLLDEFKKYLLPLRSLHNMEIIHGDPKTQNYLSDYTGIYYISDFSNSFFITEVSDVAINIYHEHYSAPEIIIDHIITPSYATDIWALAISFLDHYILDGFMPENYLSKDELKEYIDYVFNEIYVRFGDVCMVLRRCLAIDPPLRPDVFRAIELCDRYLDISDLS